MVHMFFGKCWNLQVGGCTGDRRQRSYNDDRLKADDLS